VTIGNGVCFSGHATRGGEAGVGAGLAGGNTLGHACTFGAVSLNDGVCLGRYATRGGEAGVGAGLAGGNTLGHACTLGAVSLAGIVECRDRQDRISEKRRDDVRSQDNGADKTCQQRDSNY